MVNDHEKPPFRQYFVILSKHQTVANPSFRELFIGCGGGFIQMFGIDTYQQLLGRCFSKDLYSSNGWLENPPSNLLIHLIGW